MMEGIPGGEKFHNIQCTEEFWHQFEICSKSKENH